MPSRRAFIAAPLIGTIIFVTAIVYSVNLAKTESQSVGLISDDAYHNRVVSLLTLYKSDLLGLFADGLRQNAEDFLASNAWIGINTLDNFNQSHRFQRCAANKDILHNQLVASGSYSGGAANNYHLKGLSGLLDALRKDYQFEGIKFKAVNFGSFTASNGDVIPFNFSCNMEPGHQVCEKLLPVADFDCENFAVHLDKPYQCCSINTTLDVTTCPADKVIRGCENGNFFLQVDLSNDDVYKAMPRISATDERGNVIRSNVLGDRSFRIPIRYPLFKYQDASSRLYAFDGFYNQPGIASLPTAPVSVPRPASFDADATVQGMYDACRFFHNSDLFKDIGFSFKHTITNPYTEVTVTCKDGSLSNQPQLRSNLQNAHIDDKAVFYGIVLMDYDPRFKVNPEMWNTLTVDHTYYYG